MPYKTKTKFNLVPCPGATPAASAAPPQTVPDPDAAELQRTEQVKREDAAYSKWLEGCQGYYDGCFTCHAFMVDQVYFCADANRDVFGADVIEVEMLQEDGEAASPDAATGAHARKKAGRRARQWKGAA